VLMIGFAAFQVLLPKLVEQEWDGSVGDYGLLFTLQGVGMVMGSVVLAQVSPTRRRGPLIYTLFFINSIFGVLMGLSPLYEGAALLQVGRGFCIGFGITLWDTMLMQRVPQHMLSRVISMDWFGSIGLLPAGLGIWAVLSELGPPGLLLSASSGFCALLFLAGLSDRRIRSVD
jgi:predicted MFS family arabinose efflux permease